MLEPTTMTGETGPWEPGPADQRVWPTRTLLTALSSTLNAIKLLQTKLKKKKKSEYSDFLWIKLFKQQQKKISFKENRFL